MERKVVVNSLSVNKREFNQSGSIDSLLKRHQADLEKLDLNQEMVFETDLKRKGDFRKMLQREGEIKLIDGKIEIPQLILGEWAFNYSQLMSLEEENLLAAILGQQVCHHARFFEDQLVYKADSQSSCIYCYSASIKRKLTVRCRFLDSKCQETHQLLSFCENMFIPFKIVQSKEISVKLNKLVFSLEEFVTKFAKFDLFTCFCSVCKEFNATGLDCCPKVVGKERKIDMIQKLNLSRFKQANYV